MSQQSLYAGTNVIELNDSHFNNKGKPLTAGFIMFYAPWCPHCRDKRDSYMALATGVNGSNPSYKIYSVDTTDDKARGIVEKEGISGIPAFREVSKDGKVVPYEGHYNPDDIRSKATSQLFANESTNAAKSQTTNQKGGNGNTSGTKKRCSGSTLNGTRCKRNACYGKYCHQHY